jgi:hypothetical protein
LDSTHRFSLRTNIILWRKVMASISWIILLFDASYFCEWCKSLNSRLIHLLSNHYDFRSFLYFIHIWTAHKNIRWRKKKVISIGDVFQLCAKENGKIKTARKNIRTNSKLPPLNIRKTRHAIWNRAILHAYLLRAKKIGFEIPVRRNHKPYN